MKNFMGAMLWDREVGVQTGRREARQDAVTLVRDYQAARHRKWQCVGRRPGHSDCALAPSFLAFKLFLTVTHPMK